MAKLKVLGAVAILMFLVACGGASGEGADAKGAPQDGEMVEQRGSFGGEAPALVFEAPAGLPEPEAAAMSMLESGPFESFAEEFDRGMSGEELLFLAGNLEISQRKVISVASVSIEVEVVEAAVTEVRVIAESLGGFVEQLSSSGEPDRQQAHVTVRVPQAQFFTALERIDALGEVQSRTVGSEDVSEQFIDLEARLKSSLREEQSFLSLLGRTETVGEILTIERELSRVRSEIERLQGRLNFLGTPGGAGYHQRQPLSPTEGRGRAAFRCPHGRGARRDRQCGCGAEPGARLEGLPGRRLSVCQR